MKQVPRLHTGVVNAPNVMIAKPVIKLVKLLFKKNLKKRSLTNV